MKETIPKRLEDKLSGAVSNILFPNSINNGDAISTYLETTPYYFGEYTIHGARHAKAVLDYADRLIPQSDYDKLDELSISILVLGIFLHDLGMFIKPDGLEYLLNLDEKEPLNKQYTWKELWDKHIFKLQHASGSEQDEVFADTEHIFDTSSEVVCASFIRTYHHEIALHIALHGFPGLISHPLLNGIDSDHIKLAGLLAKSHGVPLRDMKTEIDSFGYDNNLPLNVPIYYLMSILRLADLLDADGNRAPKALSDMNEFSSKRSKNEWILNDLIKNRQWPEQTGKPETLKIIASPTNSIQFLELKDWFDYWQKELDLSWAVIGEKHGDTYKLSIRRITSNIFEEIFKEDCKFVTSNMALKVNPDIVKLLVGPLYNNNPSFGVRELLQNAIDACNERTAIDGTIGEITVDVNEKTGLFTITDNGIGMNEDVIANYYLTAGASYRKSRDWAETFVDSNNNPKLARSGRFGVGALATFLIGDKAKIITRHINDETGYCFEYTIEPHTLNIEKVSRTSPGTTIEIVMNDTAKKVFFFKSNVDDDAYEWTNWYHLTIPKITYVRNGQEIKRKEEYNLRKNEDSNGWFSCELANYDSFHWTCIHSSGPIIMCNGIHILDSTSSYPYSLTSYSYIISEMESRGCYNLHPSMAIRDKNGNFPVNLARTTFENFTLDDNVVVELCKYRIAQVLVNGVNDDSIFSEKGFLPNERAFLLGIPHPVYLICRTSQYSKAKAKTIQGYMAIAYPLYVYSSTPPNVKIDIAGEGFEDQSIFSKIWQSIDEDIFEVTINNKFFKGNIRYIDFLKKWPKSLPTSLRQYIDYHTEFIIRYIPSPLKKEENNIMYKTIQELLPRSNNDGWIPLDRKERETVYPDAFKELKRYIDFLDSQKKEEKIAKRGSN